MTMTETAIEFQIKALRNALRSAKQEADGIRNEPFRPWRDEGEAFLDKQAAATEAIWAIENQIIDLEHQLEGPEERAEKFAEISAACAMNGGYDDPYLYMHTPMEEERFQAQIQHDVDYGYMHPEDGWVDGIHTHNPGPGRCAFCNDVLWEDESIGMDGDFGCEVCLPDLKGYAIVMCLLSQLIGFVPFYVRDDSQWGDEWTISAVESEDDDE